MLKEFPPSASNIIISNENFSNFFAFDEFFKITEIKINSSGGQFFYGLHAANESAF